MSTTITLSPELFERVTAIARQHGVTPEALIAEMLGPPPMEDEVTAVQESLKQIEQGRYRPLSEWAAEFERRNSHRRTEDGDGER